MSIKNLLPNINTPSFHLKIWELWEYGLIGKGKEKGCLDKSTGIYMFYDINDFDNPNRLDLESQNQFPFYLGKSYKTDHGNSLARRLNKHIKFQELKTKNFATYFYGVDIYIFSEDFCSKDIKDMKNDYQLNEYALTDMYELYYIFRKIAYFNKRDNHYSYKDEESHETFRDYYENQKSYKVQRPYWENKYDISKLKEHNIPLEPR